MKSLTDIERHEAEAIQTEARRLCRAAPDLLAACEAADQFLFQFRSSPLRTPEAIRREETAREISDLLRAAISKAKEPIR